MSSTAKHLPPPPQPSTFPSGGTLLLQDSAFSAPLPLQRIGASGQGPLLRVSVSSFGSLAVSVDGMQQMTCKASWASSIASPAPTPISTDACISETPLLSQLLRASIPSLSTFPSSFPTAGATAATAEGSLQDPMCSLLQAGIQLHEALSLSPGDSSPCYIAAVRSALFNLSPSSVSPSDSLYITTPMAPAFDSRSESEPSALKTITFLTAMGGGSGCSLHVQGVALIPIDADAKTVALALSTLSPSATTSPNAASEGERKGPSCEQSRGPRFIHLSLTSTPSLQAVMRRSSQASPLRTRAPG
jgi:hypothetical protein